MRPTLLEGDVELVNRLAYDVKLPLTDVVVAPLGEPQRGDVVTFTSPKDGVKLIKRLVGVPVNVVEMRSKVLYLNGVAADYLDPVALSEPLGGGQTPAIQARERVAGHVRAVQVLPELNALRSFGPVQVPAGQYFFLGDNRDKSAVSRFIGMVQRHLLIGRVLRVLVSANILGNWLPSWLRTLEGIELPERIC
jgi:signal peptidase I